jgi:hypothetical protein
MYIIMGLNAPNSKYFCLYCNCESNNRWNMNLQWAINENTKCKLYTCMLILIYKKLKY